MQKIVTIQTDINDCGPAVVYSLVKYYKGYVSIEKIRLDTNLDKEGVTAFDLVVTLKNYGFDATGLKLTIEELKEVSKPIILHWNLSKYNHYVLLLKNKKDIWTIMDPSRGIVNLNTKDLLSVWTGVVIKAIPNGSIIKLDKSVSLWKLMQNLIQNNRRLIVAIMFLSLFLTILGLILNYYLQFLISSPASEKIIILFLILTVFKIFCEYYLVNVSLQFNRNVDYSLLDSYTKHLLHLPLPSLEGSTVGRTLKHIEDLQKIKEFFLELLLKVGWTLLQVIVGLVLLVYLHKNLSLFLGMIILVYVIIKIIENKKNTVLISYCLNKSNEYQNLLVSTIKNYKTIKDLHKENYYQNDLMKKTLDYFDYQTMYSQKINNWQIRENLFLEISIFGLTTYAFILGKNGEISMANLFTFIALMNYLIYSVKEIMETLPKYNYLQQSYRRISEFGDVREENFDKGLPFTNGNIKFSHVSFTYNNGNSVIKNLNHIIYKGQKVILSGASGRGKSTLCKLLYRYYDLTSGTISINGIDINSINLHSLRDNICYVSQEAVLFEKTIMENIVLNNQIDIYKLNKVLNICALDELISKLPNHLETSLREASNNISGGQMERIILARALYNIKPIMILDEALSQVDITTEKQIIKKIIDEYKDCTLIYITHKDVRDMFKNKISLSS